MTSIQIDIHHLTHTCPAETEPHPYDTRRTVLAVVPGGACRQPVTVHCGDITAVIACGRHVPREQRCPACRITVIEHSVTFTHTGHHNGSQARPCQPMPTGLAADPCYVCGEPLAAALADYGTHLLCRSRRSMPTAVQLVVPGLQHSTDGNAS